jgi:FKBP-type peptidyl-prolyl cis-trans isomerase FklB
MQINESLPIGTILDSGVREYEIVSVLGKGGFGITYLATSTIQVGNIPAVIQFAIKEHYISSMNERQGVSVSVPNVSNTEEIKASVDSFLVEAQRLNKLSLNHPGIVRVNESFRANGTAYYVMEYIKGDSLRKYVKESYPKGLSEKDALQLFKPIAETISYLHQSNVTHLDIKPDNILIRENGQPVLIDFGLSKHYNSKGSPTSTIKAAGCSEGYSPMEQYAGITSFTPEADIYALAATLLYMLTGKDPMISTEINPSFIRKSLPEQISEKTTNEIIKAMEKLKENRTKRVDDMMKVLYSDEGIEETSSPEEEMESPSNKTEKFKIKEFEDYKDEDNEESQGFKLNKQHLWIAALAAVIAIVVAIFIFIPQGKSKSAGSELRTAEDSMAYAIGMAQTLGLMEYLDSTMQIDTTLMKEFKDGLYFGAGLKKGEAYPDYDGERKKAFDAGVNIGNQIESKMIPGINQQVFGDDSSKTISITLFMSGFTDAIDRNYHIFNVEKAQEVANELMESFQVKAMEKEFGSNKVLGEKFLEENAQKEGVHTLESGVQYKILKEGSGEIPSEESTVTVNYEGRTIDGTVFDSSYERGEPVTLRCNQVIKGWTDVLVHMPVGSKWEVYIPQELAYGARQQGENIKPFSMLIFTIELISIK